MKSSLLTPVFLGVVLLAAVPLRSQVDNSGAQLAVTDAIAVDNRMLTPPPVSGESYPGVGTSGERSNYLRYGLTFTTAYSDNVLGGISTNPASDVGYSIWPTLALDQTTPRWHSVFTYSPGFTFYQKTSERNEADQNVALNIRYRLSQHVTVSLQDSFRKSSSVFNQPDFTAANPVSGSPEPPTVAVIAPIADQLSNNGNGGITYQFGPNSMVGASGTSTYLHYPNPAEVPGLYDSNTAAGSAFYNHRLSKKHYIGVTYRYARILANPLGSQNVSQTEIQTHSVSGFYTVYFRPNLSLSLSGGPQHYDATQPPLPASSAWTPTVTASLGWQGRRTSFAASYSRIVSGAGGLLGAYHSNSADGSASWQIARTWNVGSSASYSIYKTLTPFFFLASPGGHTVSGTASVQHQLGEHLSVQAGYSRVHQSYDGIALVSTFPDTNREFVTISYHFARPLGR